MRFVECMNRKLALKMFVPFFMVIFISSVAAEAGHPEFAQGVEQVVLEEGELGTVKCISRRESPLTYSWYNKYNQKIPSDPSKEIYTSESDGVLTFAEVKRSHAGLYFCRATNKLGMTAKSYDIVVEYTIGNITSNETAVIVSVKVTNITEHTVEFDVQTKGYPKSFYIRYREMLSREEFTVEIKTGDRALVKDLLPAGSYQFGFQIDPPSQYNTPSVSQKVVMLPGVPDVIFRSIQNGFVNLEWFRSTSENYRNTIEEYELSYDCVRLEGGQSWAADNCAITITIPHRKCSPTNYTLSGLERGMYYEIRMRVRTSSGYGKPYIGKVYIEK